ncbi:cellulase family glycosylhydrolase [Oculatella sp. LEGE 06141]|nr:cellulase family glycosylhydrolase [Oculatella sp. LEGE 06141]
MVSLSLKWFVPLHVATASTVTSLPLTVRGTEIIDARGQPLGLRGVNWFGFETEFQVPHGLWTREYQDMLTQIKSLGYNLIRLPYSIEALRSDHINAVDFSLGRNRELEGKTPLEAMDLIIEEAERQGLMILLDSHRLNNRQPAELWYDDEFSEDDWIDTWRMLAQRYRDRKNVIGADLQNEPYGRASWGTGDRATDWRLAAERAGNAVLDINPNWLIVVQGVENNVPGQRLARHWRGGNLEGVRRFPVRLSKPDQLVYSVHEYGSGVFDQPWFSEPTFPANLFERWETGFHYIVTQGIAPVFIGEFGGRQVDSQSTEGIWQRTFVHYIQANRLSFAYWSWNPDSVDTGGILTDDWQTVDAPKQDLLSQLLPDAPRSRPVPNRSPGSVPQMSPTPTSPRSSEPTPPSSVSSTSATALRTEFMLQSDWQTGFCVSVRVTNQGNTDIRNWRLRFEMNQATINQSWNGHFAQQGTQYSVTPPEWGATLQPQQTVDIGFCAEKQGEDYLPGQIRAIE